MSNWQYLFILIIVYFRCGNALLYPKNSPTRLVLSLDGLWNMKLYNLLDQHGQPTQRATAASRKQRSPNLGANGITYLMPVPSSYNDITQNSTVQNFFGEVEYFRDFWVHDDVLTSQSTRWVIRIGSANYYSIVYLNDYQVMIHEGGHLPFDIELVWFYLFPGVPQEITISVNNTLTPHTLPPANSKFYEGPGYPSGGINIINGQFRFFNYAGIDRSVFFYTTPKVYIDDVILVTKVPDNSSADVYYTIHVGGVYSNSTTGVCVVTVPEVPGNNGPSRDYTAKSPIKNGTATGVLHLMNPILWWPWTLNETAGKLYAFNINCTDRGITDIYKESFGLREIKINGTSFLVNGKPFYFSGVNKYEDWNIVGSGVYEALVAKDINLLKWMGVVAVRTSDYPHSEEFLNFCDKEGIVVIDETPAVGLRYQENFDETVLQKHITVLKELYGRDKNRPSVFIWSLASEPDSALSVAQPYFKKLSEVMHELDPTRPVSFACSNSYDNDLATQYMDVVMINNYYSWYGEYGRLDLIPGLLANDLDKWYSKTKKPILLSHYGTYGLPGVQKDPPSTWSQEYQTELLMTYWSVFDEYRHKFLIGELVWTFADFETHKGTNKGHGSYEGLLTRNRDPKMAAHAVKERYMALAKEQDNHS